MQDVNLKNYLQLHLIVFIWGFTAILGELITLSALPLVWTRILIALSLIFIYIKVKGISLKYSPKLIVTFILCGFVIALHWFTFFHAIKISNISITLACISTGAFFTSLLEPIFFKRKIVWYEVLLGILVVIGLGIIFSVETQYVEGILVALLSAFLSACFSIINGKFAGKYDSNGISFYELLGGLLFLTVCLFFSDGFTSEVFHFEKLDWLWLFILGSVCTAYPFIASINIMRYLSPYTCMLTINLEPIYGILLAVLIFKNQEKMTPEFYLGALIILSTVLLNVYFKNRKKRKVI